MSEDELKDCILANYNSISEFSIEIGLPRSTVYTILKRGVKKSNFDNIIKICNGLNIPIDTLIS